MQQRGCIFRRTRVTCFKAGPWHASDAARATADAHDAVNRREHCWGAECCCICHRDRSHSSKPGGKQAPKRRRSGNFLVLSIAVVLKCIGRCRQCNAVQGRICCEGKQGPAAATVRCRGHYRQQWRLKTKPH